MGDKSSSCGLYEREPVCDATPDYEAEYIRLIEENRKLREQNFKLRNTIVGMCMSSYGMTSTEIYGG